MNFLLVLLGLFLLGVTADALEANIGSKSAISLQWGRDDPKFQVKRVAPTNHFSSQKTTINDLSYGIKIWTDLSSVLSQFTRLTNRQTDGRTNGLIFLIASPRWHSMQRGKKQFMNHSLHGTGSAELAKFCVNRLRESRRQHPQKCHVLYFFERPLLL